MIGAPEALVTSAGVKHFTILVEVFMLFINLHIVFCHSVPGNRG